MPYRSYRTRARRLESQVRQDEGPARFVDLQYPSISGREPSNWSRSWKPSPDDLMRVRDGYKWAGRIWDMSRFGFQAGSDAMIPVLGDAYNKFVRGYEAVEQAFKSMKAGYETYEMYRDKLQSFRDSFPGSPAPHEVSVSGTARAPGQLPSVDPGQFERYDFGQRRSRRRDVYSVPQTYGQSIARRPRGGPGRENELGGRVRSSGGHSRKIDHKSHYEFS